LLFCDAPQELMEFAMNKDQSLAIPYRIADGKINDVTVDVERPVTWTRAMKYLLTNLKWLTAWAAAWRRGSVKMDV
jgi:beclin